jgi:ankyrin repeat protein
VLAARAGDAELVEKLLEAGANADARAIDGMPAIVAAAQSGQIEIVHRLIAAGCRVDVSTPGQPSALEVAVRSTDVAMTRALIDAGSNVVMLACIPSDNPLTAAEESGATEIVEMIRGALPPELANIDRDVAQEIALDDLTYESQRDLPRQAAFGDLDKVRELLAVKGVEIDGFDALSRTALSAAAEAGRHPVVQELLEAGADVNKCNEVVGSPRSTALVCAAIGPSAERDGILKLLFAAGVDADQLGSDGRTALSHAVERDVGFFGRAGEFALSTRTLIEAGADLEIRDRYDLTPRMRALSLASSIEIEEVAEQYQALARLLEEAGASKVGLAEIELLWAVMAGEVEQVRELLAAGVNANARRHDGPTALILAARDGERDSVRLLTEAGADVLAREWVDRGPTALDTAADGDDHALTRILREAQGEDGS